MPVCVSVLALAPLADVLPRLLATLAMLALMDAKGAIPCCCMYTRRFDAVNARDPSLTDESSPANSDTGADRSVKFALLLGLNILKIEVAIIIGLNQVSALVQGPGFDRHTDT